jgi:hypothetical protein
LTAKGRPKKYDKNTKRGMQVENAKIAMRAWLRSEGIEAPQSSQVEEAGQRLIEISAQAEAR